MEECCVHLSQSNALNVTKHIHNKQKKFHYNPLYSSIPRCRASQDCPSFLLDYDRSACFRLDINTEDSRELIVPSESRFVLIKINSPVLILILFYDQF